MQLPLGLNSDNSKGSQVCRLLKSLYGLKQASWQWNVKLTNALIKTGFHQSRLDYSLMTKRTAEGIVIVLIYVDDLLITGCSKRLIDNAKQVLKNNFKIKDLRDLRYFLGIEFARNSEGILMHQRKYAMELISDSEMSGSKPCATPVEVN